LNSPHHTTSGPLILALDTSSKVTSLAIARGGELLASIQSHGDDKRSEKLWSEIEALLAERRLTISDVDVFAVCTGPGGFTGLRVGIAAVKGFAAALSKPVCGVTSVQAAAFAAGPASRVYVMVNAYKNEVYSQLFSVGGDEASCDLPVALNEPLVSSFEAAFDRVSDLKDAIGAGEIEGEQLQRRAYAFVNGKWTIVRTEQLVAENIARIALIRYGRGEVESAATLKACYVRPSEAEIKLSLGLLGSKIKRSIKR
jgi:tRNA threonylcarbamoyladenosine biosynthesis protein TsaB